MYERICRVADPFFYLPRQWGSEASTSLTIILVPGCSIVGRWAVYTYKKELKRRIANRGIKESYTMEECLWEIWKWPCT
ncbi:hypothetical protein CHI08_09800 [Peribacillus simplex]|nr:hypothetical protein CHI08_09800 [Peribacillus simplex]